MNQNSFSLGLPMSDKNTIEMEECHRNGASEHLPSLPNENGRSISETSLIGDHIPVHEHQGFQIVSSECSANPQPCSCSCHTRSTSSRLYNPSQCSSGNSTHSNVSSGYETSSQPYSYSCHTWSTQSRSSDPSYYSGNSYTHLNQDIPRYGYPDDNPPSHCHHHHQSSLTVPSTLSIPNEIPAISIQTPTPVMENVAISPAGTEPFNSVARTPLEESDHQILTKARPQSLPIPAKSAAGDYTGSLVSDNVLLTGMLFLQNQNCSNRKKCATCKLIKRQFGKIVECNGQEAVREAIKNIQTHGAEGHKQLRRREKHPTPVCAAIRRLGFKQRSQLTSHLHDMELTFSSTETKDDKRTHWRERQTQRAVIDDEYGTKDDLFSRLPVKSIGKEAFDDGGSIDDSIMSSRPSSNTHLDLEESIISSGVKMHPNSVLQHLQEYGSASSRVYSSSDTENSIVLNNIPSYMPSHHKIQPVSSDIEISLSNKEGSPSPLLLSPTLPNPMTRFSTVSASSCKHHTNQTSPSNEEMYCDQDILTGYVMLNVLSYSP